MCATRCWATERMAHSHGVPCAGEAPTLALPLARRSGGLALSLRCLIQGVAEHPPWQSTGMTSVFQQYLTINDGVVDTLRQFSDTPAPGREVVHHVFGQRLHGIGVKNRDVRCHAWTEQSAVVQTKRRGRLKRQAPHGVLQ